MQLKDTSTRKPKNSKTKVCNYWDCRNISVSGKFLCEFHMQGYVFGLIEDCPDCSRAKNVKYQLCAICNKKECSANSSLAV